MNPHSLPRELVELENRLRHRACDEPTAALRDRVLRAAGAEAALSERSPGTGRSNAWTWAAVAAAVVVVMNLSMISASLTEFSIQPLTSPNQMAAEIQAIRLLESQQEGTFK